MGGDVLNVSVKENHRPQAVYQVISARLVDFLTLSDENLTSLGITNEMETA